MARVVVDVMLKPEILDPQGQAVANALPRLGVADVSVGAHRQAHRDRVRRRGRPRPGPRDRRQAARQPGDRRLHAACRRARGGEDAVTARIGVVTFPGSLDDRDAARAVRLAGAEPVRALARRRRPARRRRGDPAGRLLLRRLPALRRHRPVRRGHGVDRRRRPATACRCSASATASRSSARRTCCPAR